MPEQSMKEENIILRGSGIEKTFIREDFLGVSRTCIKALDGVDFDLSGGGILGIVGESGSGKSTLAKIICGLEKQSSGDLFWEPTDRFKTRASRAQIVFQNPFSSLNPKLSIGYMMKEALTCGRSGSRAAVKQADIRRVLAHTGLEDVDLGKYPHQFSGGQRQRLVIARSLAVEPEILVCDEPVSALDISIQAQIINLLIDINRKMGLTIIFIAHDIEAVSMISEDIMVMKSGRVVESGKLKDIVNDPRTEYTKMLLDAVPRNPWL